jgi:hypothetical protein
MASRVRSVIFEDGQKVTVVITADGSAGGQAPVPTCRRPPLPARVRSEKEALTPTLSRVRERGQESASCSLSRLRERVRVRGSTSTSSGSLDRRIVFLQQLVGFVR